MKPIIPEYMDASEKDVNGEQLTALERFVYENEPAGSIQEEEFRSGLEAVVDQVYTAGLKQGLRQEVLKLDSDSEALTNLLSRAILSIGSWDRGLQDHYQKELSKLTGRTK